MLIRDEDQGNRCLPLMKKKDNVHIRLCQSPYKNVMNNSDTFIANRDKLYMNPELAEIVYDKVENNKVLVVATIC